MKKSHKLLILSVLFLSTFPAYAQSLYNGGHIPQQVEWYKTGLMPGTPTTADHVINVITWGADPTGQTNSINAINNAINYAKGKSGLKVIYFPAGHYKFLSPIILTASDNESNIVFRGEGSSTILQFSVGNQNNCFKITGSLGATPYTVNSSISKGTNQIFVSNLDNDFDPNDWIWLYEYSFPGIETGFIPCVGQVTQLTTVYQHSGIIKDKASKFYSTNNSLKVRKIVPITNVGIENLHIERIEPDDSNTGSNVWFIDAVNCWIKAVESEKTCKHHVEIRRCSHIYVSGSYFHDANSYETGGRGYGTCIEISSTNCLIENNIFRHLRHAMLVQGGANCNVLTYNYSFDQHWTKYGVPFSGVWPGADLSLHGNYPYSNLFEHNITEKIWADDFHGENGPYNAIVRNATEEDEERTRIKLENAPNTSVLGCEISNFQFIAILISGTTSIDLDLYGKYMTSPSQSYDYADVAHGKRGKLC
ncbi:glycosyl hydrolase family 28-related protein [candidate division KSB1 bacterium]